MDRSKAPPDGKIGRNAKPLTTQQSLFLSFYTEALPEMGESRLLLMIHRMEDSTIPSQALGAPRPPVSLVSGPVNVRPFRRKRTKA